MKLSLDELKGSVAIVGAGPGDPELLTLRAHRLLARADVVLVDHLVHPSILEVCRSEARLIDVGKIPGGKQTSQEVIHHLMVKEARSGNFVVRLKGGDPFVFGRGGEEAMFLRRHDVPFELVAGISSCIAAPESGGIPVTHRGVSTHFTVVTATALGDEFEATWSALARTNGTIVVLMGVRRLPQIVATLQREGRSPDTPVAIVQQGTTEHEVVVEGTLRDIEERANEVGVTSPAVIVIGDVVALRHHIAARPAARIAALQGA